MGLTSVVEITQHNVYHGHGYAIETQNVAMAAMSQWTCARMLVHVEAFSQLQVVSLLHPHTQIIIMAIQTASIQSRSALALLSC